MQSDQAWFLMNLDEFFLVEFKAWRERTQGRRDQSNYFLSFLQYGGSQQQMSPIEKNIHRFIILGPGTF
jgi:hypothetical protein